MNPAVSSRGVPDEGPGAGPAPIVPGDDAFFIHLCGLHRAIAILTTSESPYR